MNFQQVLAMAVQQGGGAAVSTYAAWPALIGAEMMTNGDCSSGTGWTLGAGVVIAAGKMTQTAASSITTNGGVPDYAFTVGATYRNAFTIDTVSIGSVQLAIGTTAGTSRSTVATFSQDLVYGGTGGWKITGTSTSMQLDNFSATSYGGMGQEASWTLTGGDVFWNTFPDNIGFDGSNEGSKAELTGGSKTAFDAAVSNSTACTVTLTTSTGSPMAGTISVTMKGGGAVNFVFDGGGAPVAHAVTSGAGSGFILTAGNDNPSGIIALIRISPA